MNQLEKDIERATIKFLLRMGMAFVFAFCFMHCFPLQRYKAPIALKSAIACDGPKPVYVIRNHVMQGPIEYNTLSLPPAWSSSPAEYSQLVSFRRQDDLINALLVQDRLQTQWQLALRRYREYVKKESVILECEPYLKKAVRANLGILNHK